MISILMVVTSHGDIDGKPTTGVWFSEFSEPFELFREAGAKITVASPRGGPAPVDPRGYPSREEIAGVRDALERLNATEHLTRMSVDHFDAIFMPGGHGPMFDLAADPVAKRLIAAFWAAGKPVGAVCHGPASLLNVVLVRLSHLRYIAAHKEHILFGGPTLSAQGAPERMIIVLNVPDIAAAEAFVSGEPYSANKVFETVEIRAWSQVLPEPTAGALSTAIAHEEEKMTGH